MKVSTLFALVDSYYIICHVSNHPYIHKRCLPGKSTLHHQQTNLDILNHHHRRDHHLLLPQPLPPIVRPPQPPVHLPTTTTTMWQCHVTSSSAHAVEMAWVEDYMARCHNPHGFRLVTPSLQLTFFHARGRPRCNQQHTNDNDNRHLQPKDNDDAQHQMMPPTMTTT